MQEPDVSKLSTDDRKKLQNAKRDVKQFKQDVAFFNENLNQHFRNVDLNRNLWRPFPGAKKQERNISTNREKAEMNLKIAEARLSTLKVQLCKL